MAGKFFALRLQAASDLMKFRSFLYVLAGIVLTMLLVAAGGFYWLVSQSPLNLLKGSQETTPSAAMFVPKQAPAMVSLLVSPEKLAAFRLAVVRPAERRQARAELNQLKQSLLANTGLDYDRDVKPWLGKEFTLAVTTLDIDRDLANGKQPGYLLAIATQNPERSREFLQLFWQKRAVAGADLVFEQYKGVRIIHGNVVEDAKGPGSGAKTNSKFKAQNSKSSSLLSPLSSLLPSPSLASAAVGDRFILFANHPKVLRDAINNVQAPDLSLRNASFYNQTLETLTQSRIGLGFVNLPGLSSWVGESAAQPKGGNSPAAKNALSKGAPSKDALLTSKEPSPPNQTLAVSLKLDRQGLLADTALIDKDGKSTTVSPLLSEPVAALKYIPASSPLSISGVNLNRTWTGLSENLKSYGTISRLVNQPLVDIQKRWNVDLPKDVFSWVKGEYALGFVPQAGKVQDVQTSKLPSSSLSKEWVFIAKRDSNEVKQGIERLDTIAQKQGLSVGPVKLGDQIVSTWTRLTTGSNKRIYPWGCRRRCGVFTQPLTTMRF